MDLVEFDDGVTSGGVALFKTIEALSRGAFFFSTSVELKIKGAGGGGADREMMDSKAPGMCEHRFCSQTKTIWDRNCTACFSLANIFNQSRNKSFGAKLQSEVTGGFTQVRIGNLINQSATSCAISIPPLLDDCSEQKTFNDVARRWLH